MNFFFSSETEAKLEFYKMEKITPEKQYSSTANVLGLTQNRFISKLGFA